MHRSHCTEDVATGIDRWATIHERQRCRLATVVGEQTEHGVGGDGAVTAAIRIQIGRTIGVGCANTVGAIVGNDAVGQGDGAGRVDEFPLSILPAMVTLTTVLVPATLSSPPPVPLLAMLPVTVLLATVSSPPSLKSAPPPWAAASVSALLAVVMFLFNVVPWTINVPTAEFQSPHLRQPRCSRRSCC